MSIFSATNIRNKRQFREEKSLYVVEPIVQYAASWMNISDVTEIEKSKILFFDELKGKELYAKDVRVDENTYWKTYIVQTLVLLALIVLLCIHGWDCLRTRAQHRPQA